MNENLQASSSPSTDQDLVALLNKAKEIAPIISASSSENEVLGKLSDRTVELLHSGGFFGLSIPRSLGGWEAGPIDQMLIVEELSRADGATGWVLHICGNMTIPDQRLHTAKLWKNSCGVFCIYPL